MNNEEFKCPCCERAFAADAIGQIFCEDCEAHADQRPGLLLHERTHQARTGEPCPLALNKEMRVGVDAATAEKDRSTVFPNHCGYAEALERLSPPSWIEPECRHPSISDCDALRDRPTLEDKLDGRVVPLVFGRGAVDVVKVYVDGREVGELRGHAPTLSFDEASRGREFDEFIARCRHRPAVAWFNGRALDVHQFELKRERSESLRLLLWTDLYPVDAACNSLAVARLYLFIPEFRSSLALVARLKHAQVTKSLANGGELMTDWGVRECRSIGLNDLRRAVNFDAGGG